MEKFYQKGNFKFAAGIVVGILLYKILVLLPKNLASDERLTDEKQLSHHLYDLNSKQ